MDNKNCLSEREVLDFFYSYLGKFKKMLLIVKKLKLEIPEDLRVYYKERICLIDMYRRKIERMTKNQEKMNDDTFVELTDKFLDYVERQTYYIENVSGRDIIRIETNNFNISFPFWTLIDLINVIAIISDCETELLTKPKNLDTFNILRKIESRMKKIIGR